MFSGEECGWKSYQRGIIQTCLANISILRLLKFYNFPSSGQSTMYYDAPPSTNINIFLAPKNCIRIKQIFYLHYKLYYSLCCVFACGFCIKRKQTRSARGQAGCLLVSPHLSFCQSSKTFYECSILRCLRVNISFIVTMTRSFLESL